MENTAARIRDLRLGHGLRSRYEITCPLCCNFVTAPYAVSGISLVKLFFDNGLVASGIIPKKAGTDAAHIALAAIHNLDFLLTWNCTHIANAAISRGIEEICRERGIECPVICTPEELMGGMP